MGGKRSCELRDENVVLFVGQIEKSETETETGSAHKFERMGNKQALFTQEQLDAYQVERSLHIFSRWIQQDRGGGWSPQLDEFGFGHFSTIFSAPTSFVLLSLAS